MFWGEYPKDLPFLFIYKRESDNWGAQRAGGLIKLSFKDLKAMLSDSSHKIGSGLMFFSKTYRSLAIKEKFGIQFQQ